MCKHLGLDIIPKGRHPTIILIQNIVVNGLSKFHWSNVTADQEQNTAVSGMVKATIPASQHHGGRGEYNH